MLISINGKWKLPIGYFFQKKISAVSQAELVSLALRHTHNVGIKVWSIVCNGAYTNISTMKYLGCILDGNYDEMKCWFSHPFSKEKVYFIPDACHNLKLARNTLGNCKYFESNKGNVKWSHIINLHNVQNVITFKFSNKISSAHIHWYNNKMKVKYAAQTLSSSTADALEYLKQINITGFSNIDVTQLSIVELLTEFLISLIRKAHFEKDLNLQFLKIILSHSKYHLTTN